MTYGFKSRLAHHDGVTKKMSLHFFQVSYGFAGFLEQKPKNSFTVDVQAVKSVEAGLPPGFSGRGPRFFAFAAFFLLPDL